MSTLVQRFDAPQARTAIFPLGLIGLRHRVGGLKSRGALLVLLAVAAFGAAACDRQVPAPAKENLAATATRQPAPSALGGNIAPAAPAAAGTGTAALEPLAPMTDELHRPPQSVTLPRPLAPASPPASPSADSSTTAKDSRALAEQERRLAERQAALEAREAKLRRREAAQHSIFTAAAPPSSAGGSPADEAGATAGDVGSAAGTAGAAMAGGAGANGPFGAAGGPGPGAPGPGGRGAATDGSPSAALPEAEERPRTTATVPAGTRFEVEFTQGLASNTSSVGDTFRARVLADITLDGAVAIPAGSEILGVVTDAVAARRIGGQAKLSLKLTDLVLPSGSTVPVHASFLEEGKSKTGRDAATIGGSAAGGALLGRILGRSGRGTILGALVGAAVGTAIASKTAGEEVVIPEGSVVKLKLDQGLEVKIRR